MGGRRVVPPDRGRMMLSHAPSTVRSTRFISATGRGCALVLSIAVILTVGLASETRAAWPHSPGVNVPLCTATFNQLNPTIVSDGAGGAIVTWYDNRGPYYDIYAQHVLASGAVDGGWPTAGGARVG